MSFNAKRHATLVRMENIRCAHDLALGNWGNIAFSLEKRSLARQRYKGANWCDLFRSVHHAFEARAGARSISSVRCPCILNFKANWEFGEVKLYAPGLINRKVQVDLQIHLAGSYQICEVLHVPENKWLQCASLFIFPS